MSDQLRNAIKRKYDVDIVSTCGLGKNVLGTKVVLFRGNIDDSRTWMRVGELEVPGCLETIALRRVLDSNIAITPRIAQDV